MSEYIKYILRGTDILFGDEKIEIKRNKSLDSKKELRISKAIRKSSMIERSSNRIKKAAAEALSWVEKA